MTSISQPGVAVLGAGSWGTALGLLLARNGHAVQLWGHDVAQCAAGAARENAHYLPGIRFPDSLHIEANPRQLAGTTQQFLLAVPSHAFRATLKAPAASRFRRDAGLGHEGT